MKTLWHGLSFPVRASVLLQLAALPAVLVPGAWPWVVFWIVLQHGVLSIAGTIPRSTLLGPNRTTIDDPSAVALTFDDGPDPEVTPQVLDVLERRGVKATFFLIGERASLHPKLVSQIVAAGHGVENHTQHHSSWFCTYTLKQLRRECMTAQQAICDAGAPAPTRFRAPAGVRSPWLQPVLSQMGLELTSWSRRGFDTSQRDPGRVLRRLTQGLSAGEILLLHDGNAATTDDGEPMVLKVLEPLLDQIEAMNLTARQLKHGANEA